MATFPYSPARVLSSPASDDILYIFQPGSSGLQLLSLNSSQTLDNTSLPYSTISSSLPFLDGAQGNAYTAAMDDRGDILVYTGACGDAARATTFWQFSLNIDGFSINGTWKEHDLTRRGLNDNSGLNGANYLASAIAFSSTANSSSEMYVFGGMCPNSTSSTADNWIQGANYSNSMLVIESAQSPMSPAPRYELSISSSRGPPIAEAGFSITPLQPTFFDSGSSNDSQSRNQNFVLLGGHTQQAFINMSQVALFSLPEQSWTFLPIGSSSQEPNTELAARKQAPVDSRSGHTALLTSDGKSVIIFGGWVGDITTSADPQLAVLELGEGYGGSGDWQWSVPSQTGAGLSDGTGIYGHGATMLAGDVMMVVGGYQIPASGSSHAKRADLSMSSSIYYYNTTSKSWVTSYTHPNLKTNHEKAAGSMADATIADKKVGLGVGLVLGLLAIIAIVAFYFWYRRRLKRRRDAREAELRQLTIGANRLNLSGHSRNGRGPSEMSTLDWAGHTRALSRDEGSHSLGRGEPEAERTGLLFEIPSPTRGLRRSLHSRGIYQPTSRYDEGRRAAGFSTIHPIDERDEYDEGRIDGSSSGQNEMLQREDYNILSNVPVLDPFQDLMGGSRTPSPQSPHERELEIRNWVSDWTAADAMMHSQVGRLSPEKTDRTSSTLSDQSARSGLSSHSIQHSVGTISRSISQRSAALLSANPFRSTNDAAPVEIQRSTSQRYRPEHRRAQSLTLYPNQMRTGPSDSYVTATTSFTQIQAEGEALLGDYPGSGEPSPTRSQSRARGWMGSVRRAFTGTERSASTSPENNDSTSSSPTKLNYTEGGVPRRAASTGAMLWQKRKGARDWDVDGPKREAERSGANVEDDNDEEWDVESAVERRVVQVMFTVPKEKLRVVNRGPDGDGDSVMSAEVKEAGDGGEAKEKGKEKEHG